MKVFAKSIIKKLRDITFRDVNQYVLRVTEVKTWQKISIWRVNNWEFSRTKNGYESTSNQFHMDCWFKC